MQRNIVTYIITYICALVFCVIYAQIWLTFFDLEDNGMKFDIWLGTYICLAMSMFFFAGKLFLKPTGEKVTDFSVYIPGIVLLPICTVFYFKTAEEELNNFFDNAVNNIIFIILIILLVASVTLLPSFFLWLGMKSNKKE